MSTKAKAIPLKREPAGFSRGSWEWERCCFCRTRTPYWTNLIDRSGGEQVACCETCAAVKMATQVPTKREWFDKEARLERRP